MMMMTMKMMHPEAIPANKATSEPRILFPECPALLPSVLEPDRRGERDTEQRGYCRAERGRRVAKPHQPCGGPPASPPRPRPPRPRPSRPSPSQSPAPAATATRLRHPHGRPRSGRAGCSQPPAPEASFGGDTGRGRPLVRASDSCPRAPCSSPRSRAPASWEPHAARVLETSPAHWHRGRGAPGDCWGLGRRSTPNSFVLFDLHLKYIWKAAETLTRNRLPTQMLSTKKIAWHHYMIHLSVCHKNLTHLVIES